MTYDRLSFYPDGALGHPYGSCFEVHGHQLVRSGQQMECKGKMPLVNGLQNDLLLIMQEVCFVNYDLLRWLLFKECSGM